MGRRRRRRHSLRELLLDPDLPEASLPDRIQTFVLDTAPGTAMHVVRATMTHHEALALFNRLRRSDRHPASVKRHLGGLLFVNMKVFREIIFAEYVTRRQRPALLVFPHIK